MGSVAPKGNREFNIVDLRTEQYPEIRLGVLKQNLFNLSEAVLAVQESSLHLFCFPRISYLPAERPGWNSRKQQSQACLDVVEERVK